MEYTIVFATLILVIILFAWGKIRHDFVALISLSILVILGIVDPNEAFSGFGHPAVITVAAVLVLGKALEFSGLIDLVGKWVMRIGKNLLLQIITLSVLVAFASAFMNNVGALAIMMPIAIHMARKSGHSPSYILMPIAFASLLGGMTTLIGTPPNIIIATYRADETGEPFGMFDFTPVGAVVCLAGVLFVSFLGWRFLRVRDSKSSENESFNIEDYITEVEIPEYSKIVGLSIMQLRELTKVEMQILGMVRHKRHIHAPEASETLLPDDILILETDAADLKTIIEDTGVRLLGDQELVKDVREKSDITITEAVMLAGSSLIGRTAVDIRMRNRYGINLLAVARKEQKIHRRLDRVIFQTGDVLLLQGHEHLLSEKITEMGCLPLAKRDIRLGYKTKIPLALAIFLAAIATVVSGLMPVQVAFSIGALAMVLLRILPVKEVYKSIDWPVIVLLAAMLPVGTALETSGGADKIAGIVLGLTNYLPPWGILAIIMLTTMLLSDVINNAATVVLMAPIALSVAHGMGLSIDPFLMAVAIGGSSAFLTPIGHQSNTLVMGPGGYKFTDYWRMGLPLDIIILTVGVPLILKIWPM
ncbi:MAG: SLC13 family permease [Bacteroidia bacterium]